VGTLHHHHRISDWLHRFEDRGHASRQFHGQHGHSSDLNLCGFDRFLRLHNGTVPFHKKGVVKTTHTKPP